MEQDPKQGSLIRAFARGYFPHELSWLIDNPLRRLLITPETFGDRLHRNHQPVVKDEIDGLEDQPSTRQRA